MSGWFKYGLWLIITYGYAYLIGGKIPYFIFYTSLVLFLAAALGKWALKNIAVETALSSDRSQVGGSVTLEIKVTNNFFLPLPWFTCAVFLPEEFGEMSRPVALLYLKAKSTETLVFTLPCDCRGIFGGGLLEIKLGDIFGLMTFIKKREFPFELIVYPRLIDIKRLLLGSGNVFGRQTLFRLGRQTSFLAGVRKYTSGDQLSHIHWKASAKKNEFLVKEYEKQMIDKIHILVDANASHHVGEGNEGTAEWAITVAASIAEETLQKGYEVGFCICGAEKLGLPPGKGRIHLLHILELLAKVEISDTVPFSEFITREMLHRDGGTIIMVTAYLDETLAETLHGLKMHGQHPFLLFLDPTTFDSEATLHNAAELISSVNNDRIPILVAEKQHLTGESGEGVYAVQ